MSDSSVPIVSPNGTAELASVPGLLSGLTYTVPIKGVSRVPRFVGAASARFPRFTDAGQPQGDRHRCGNRKAHPVDQSERDGQPHELATGQSRKREAAEPLHSPTRAGLAGERQGEARCAVARAARRRARSGCSAVRRLRGRLAQGRRRQRALRNLQGTGPRARARPCGNAPSSSCSRRTSMRSSRSNCLRLPATSPRTPPRCSPSWRRTSMRSRAACRKSPSCNCRACIWTFAPRNTARSCTAHACTRCPAAGAIWRRRWRPSISACAPGRRAVSASAGPLVCSDQTGTVESDRR